MKSRLIVSLALAAALFAPWQACAAEKLLTVSGDATVSVAPDAAVIRIGVTSLGKTAREASEANAGKMRGVFAAIKDSGIATRDIQTCGCMVS